jgi:hypothetical protein
MVERREQAQRERTKRVLVRERHSQEECTPWLMMVMTLMMMVVMTRSTWSQDGRTLVEAAGRAFEDQLHPVLVLAHPPHVHALLPLLVGPSPDLGPLSLLCAPFIYFILFLSKLKSNIPRFQEIFIEFNLLNVFYLI